MANPVKKTPVTMLSGFLGSGKTTLLRYLLENSKEKIACIVNDVASVNIDAKLVRNDRNRASRADGVNSTTDLADTIELANGCACCSLQDELFASFEQVLALADKKGEPYARIVLENSGVAEPQNIRDKFSEAEAAGHPLLERIELDTLITVVDSGTFITDYTSRAALANRPDLGDGGNLRPVVDLLVEQIECADFVTCNKSDMLDEANLAKLLAIVSSLNPLATVISCERGQVPIETMFGAGVHSVVSKLNVEGQHRGAVAAAKMSAANVAAADAAEVKQEHGHGHGHAHAGHGHGHDGGEKHSHEDGLKHEDCGECKEEGHDHGKHEHGKHEHKHEHHHHHHSHAGEEADCKVCTAGGEAHDHKHDHSHEHHEHKHEHSHAAAHSHELPETSAARRFGIRSFVYSRRRPFHQQRLRETVLRWLPVTSNKALEGESIAVGDSPIKTVLRSKGFMWMSNSHATAYYWSHAGGHFEIRDEGDWWAAVTEADWPTEAAQKEVILQDFDKAGNFGDRRQEIVFIGVGMDQAQIEAQLDGALLTDEEMAKYSTRWAATPDPEHTVPVPAAASA